MQTELANAYSDSQVTVWGDNVTVIARAHRGARQLSPLGLVDVLGVSTMFVITAWNPKSELMTQDANNKENDDLCFDLQDLGLQFCKAEGASVDGRWAEASVAVLVGADEDSAAIQEQVHNLAIKFQQNAYFKLTSETFEVFGALFSDLHVSLEIDFSVG